MDLLGELLLASDHADARRCDAGESQPVPAFDFVMRLNNDVTNARVQMKSGENPRVHSGLDRITGAAVWRGGQIHHSRSDDVLEPVTQLYVGRPLQHLVNGWLTSTLSEADEITRCTVSPCPPLIERAEA